MARFLLRRSAQILFTLFVVPILIFVLARVMPGDIGRTILGQYATNEQVAALNAELGFDRPLVTQYLDWITDFVTGQWGDSALLNVPVAELVLSRLWASLQLAFLASLLVIPFSVTTGVLAALREGKLLDRLVSTVGLSLTAIPEFVSGVILLVIFSVELGWFPVSAQFPPGASLIERVHYLFLPALPIMFVLFGYIARMARAGTFQVLESNYYRTAVLKGLPRRRIVTKHVLRNALPPTITVVGIQVGFMAGGLVVIETLFNYPGIGKLLLDSAKRHDVIVLQACTMLVGVIIMVSNLLADISYGVLNPRVRLAAKD